MNIDEDVQSFRATSKQKKVEARFTWEVQNVVEQLDGLAPGSSLNSP